MPPEDVIASHGDDHCSVLSLRGRKVVTGIGTLLDTFWMDIDDDSSPAVSDEDRANEGVFGVSLPLPAPLLSPPLAEVDTGADRYITFDSDRDSRPMPILPPPLQALKSAGAVKFSSIAGDNLTIDRANASADAISDSNSDGTSKSGRQRMDAISYGDIPAAAPA